MVVLGQFQAPPFADLFTHEVVPISRHEKRAPDIDAAAIFVHIPPSWRLLPFLFDLKRRYPHCPLIQIEHSYSPGFEKESVRSKWRFHMLLRMAYRLFDKVVFVSQAQREWAMEFGLAKSERCDVINPLADLNGLWDIPPPEASSGRQVLGALGRFSHEKGFLRLIEAVASLPEESGVFLKIGGFGEDEAVLRNAAKGVSNIEFLGRVEDRRAFYEQIDWMCMPSKWEPYGLTALEARASGRPLLVHDVDALPDQARGCGLVVDIEDPQAFCQALENLPIADLPLLSLAARHSARRDHQQALSKWLGLLDMLRQIQSGQASRDSLKSLNSLQSYKAAASL